MFRWNRPVLAALILAVGVLAVSRAHHSAAASSMPASRHPRQLPKTVSADGSGTNVGAGVANNSVATHAAHGGALAVYANTDYGIAFSYPRNYFLAEAPDPDDHAFAAAQQTLSEQQPDALLLATVSIPDDAYPNTTFRSGSLRLSVNPGVERDACRDFAAAISNEYAAGTATIAGTAFHWRQTTQFTQDETTIRRDYAGFVNNRCYEISVEVVSDANSDLESQLKNADEGRILAKLEKIVTSLKIVR